LVLDHDVDVRVGAVLRQAGHECWPSTAGLAASADDDAVAVYADDRGAVLITHDRKVTRRRMQNTIGRHVRAWTASSPTRWPSSASTSVSSSRRSSTPTTW
jgi:predicted nuclease of predicted toxin-antitoxin system